MGCTRAESPAAPAVSAGFPALDVRCCRHAGPQAHGILSGPPGSPGRLLAFRGRFPSGEAGRAPALGRADGRTPLSRVPPAGGPRPALCGNIQGSVAGPRGAAERRLEAHGHRVLLAETFCDPAVFEGSMCKAAGWRPLGRTKGFARANGRCTDPHGMPKEIFVKPLRPDARRLLSDPRSLPPDVMPPAGPGLAPRDPGAIRLLHAGAAAVRRQRIQPPFTRHPQNQTQRGIGLASVLSLERVSTSRSFFLNRSTSISFLMSSTRAENLMRFTWFTWSLT